ncbi:MAG: twin-arginine translocase subunit TatC [Actinobacteria bacterium HGW-Actinobacteria-10]|jgi:sec-independent protein translocase protein TatC|nr:MAG: twin-arginine translocase subunit TatC [Actinobacteria bacterium HGW-Actinobacteria-10]
MPIKPKRMGWLDHLDELRRRLAVIAGVILLGSIALYAVAPELYDFFMQPIIQVLDGRQFITTTPFENFTLRFKIAFYATLVLGSPVIIWQVMAFFLPALKPNEQKWVLPTFAAMVVLFLGGAYFCHSVVLPAAFEWMIGQAWSSVDVLPSANLYFQGASLLVIAFGVGFQLPVVVFYLMLFNIVPYATLRSNWRIAYVVMMIVASVATPDWSPVTMGALFGALLVLYEASMLLARVVLAKRIAAAKEIEY